MPKVLNIRHLDFKIPENAVYCGRPFKGRRSEWGNPYIIAKDGDRSTVISRFERDVSTPNAYRRIRSELKGRDLVCWCKPEPCHADILLEIANGRRYPTLDDFYDDRRRRLSGEADYGVFWAHNGLRPWRVSYIHETGEVYAVSLKGGGPVIVLGVVLHDPVDSVDHRQVYYRTLDRILDGWEREAYREIDWARQRLSTANLSQTGGSHD